MNSNRRQFLASAAALGGSALCNNLPIAPNPALNSTPADANSPLSAEWSAKMAKAATAGKS